MEQSHLNLGDSSVLVSKHHTDPNLTCDDPILLKKLDALAYENKKLGMVNHLVAGVAHEIRNPLTIMKGFLQIIKPDLEKLNKSEIAELLLTEIHRTNELIEEFLSVARPAEHTKVKINLIPFLKNILLLYQSEAIINRCTLSHNLNHFNHPFYVMIDEGQFKQVFLNIIKNGLEAIQSANRDKGNISLSIFKRLNTVNIQIHDNGNGMDASTASKLFQPFFTTKKKGTGLGLFLCNQIIQNHRGSIRVKSTPSIGTTFFIQLPLLQTD
ncbi:ATP-binding protein [Pseudalkalibacillus hwajinpoensis]|uniref:ATP-binding protein n=1 Tax=Guptibacillus hwajinpoensis TaxID=208199 RepID=UPI00325B1587